MLTPAQKEKWGGRFRKVSRKEPKTGLLETPESDQILCGGVSESIAWALGHVGA